jgi:hypothetical protein
MATNCVWVDGIAGNVIVYVFWKVPSFWSFVWCNREKHGCVVGWSTMLQAGRLLVWDPMSDFLFYFT